MLSGRGTILVFVNDVIFRVMKGKLVPVHVGTFIPLFFSLSFSAVDCL
jgi:hypothetical protein